MPAAAKLKNAGLSVGLATLFLVGAVTAAAAQSELTGSAEDQPSGRHRFGPLYYTPRIEFRTGIDSNVFQTLSDPTRDILMVLTPRVEGSARFGQRLRMRGSALVDVNYFYRENEERFTDFYGAGQASFDLDPLILFGGGGGGEYTQRYSIDVDERLPRQEKRGHLGASIRLGPRLLFTTRASVEVITFAGGMFRLGGDIKSSLDRNTIGGAADLRYKLTPFTTLVASAEGIEDRFVSQPAERTPKRRSYRYLGGLELSPKAAISGRVMAGFREFPGTLEQGSPPYQGPVFLADLTMPVGNLARLRFEGIRDVLFASSLVDIHPLQYRNAFILTRLTGEVTFPIPGSFTGRAGAAFEEADYLLPHPYGDDPIILADRQDHRYTGSVGLVRSFGDRLRLGGYVSWSRRVSTLQLFSYEATRYGFLVEVIP